MLDPDPRGPDFSSASGNPSLFVPGGSELVDSATASTPLPGNLADTRIHHPPKRFFSLSRKHSREIHIRDLSNNYDFISSRFGIQPFVSDFRGFIFNDSNLGVRIFGNYDNNRWQYNLAAFDMLEKDTYSDLNEFERRDQQVIVANVYRQDFFARGYTAQLNFLANFDGASRHLRQE